jgi:hypothetical protein
MTRARTRAIIAPPGAQLTERIARLQETVSAVDRLMEAPATGMRLSPEEQIAIFGDDGRPS